MSPSCLFRTLSWILTIDVWVTKVSLVLKEVIETTRWEMVIIGDNTDQISWVNCKTRLHDNEITKTMWSQTHCFSFLWWTDCCTLFLLWKPFRSRFSGLKWKRDVYNITSIRSEQNCLYWMDFRSLGTVLLLRTTFKVHWVDWLVSAKRFVELTTSTDLDGLQ